MVDQATEMFTPELMARVRQIQIRTHRLVSEVLSGAYRSTMRGTGIEFEEVRPYQPGDDTRAIDWNVTARTGEAFIKTYREERQLILHFVVDTSPSMAFGTQAITKRELAAEFCALLATVAVEQKDLVGLSTFADEPGLFMPPGQGRNHVLRIVREVIAAPTGGHAREDQSELADALDHVSPLLHRRALIFVVSDFLDEKRDQWREALARLGQRHDVIAVRVVDPFEVELPSAGIVRLREIEGEGELEVDTRSRKVREAWARAAAERRQAWSDTLDRARTDRIELNTRENIADPVIRFFRSRRKGR